MLGLGRSHTKTNSLSQQGFLTLVEALWLDKVIDPIVSFKVPRLGDNGGQLTLG
jgi:hypothetical protein